MRKQKIGLFKPNKGDRASPFFCEIKGTESTGLVFHTER
jgi:hypothetical protein